MKTIALGISLYLFAIFTPNISFAAPVINNITGNVVHGQIITIPGSNFGSHSNYNSSSYKWKSYTYLSAAFKDFEDNSISSQGFGGNDLTDISIQNGGPINSGKFERMIYNSSRLANYGINQSGNDSKSIYTSFWFMMPSGTEGGKPWRWYFGSNSSSDNLYIGTQCQNTAFNLGGDFTGTTKYGSSFTSGVWHKVEIFASEPLNAYQVWIDGVSYYNWAGVWNTSHNSPSPNGHTIELPDMIDGTTTGCSTTGSYNYDDIYVDYTQARVEICNGSTWNNRGICNTQIPTSWGASSVSVVVNQGTFFSGETKYLYVIDASGNASNPILVTLGGGGIADTTPPANVVFTVPANNTTVIANTIITATATDNVGVAKIDFYLDSTSSVPIGSVSASPFTFTWNSATAANGSHILYAKASDASGNYTYSTGVTITVSNTVAPDTTLPISSITAPVNNSTVNNNITVTATATDNIGVTRVDFYIDGATTPAATATAAPYNFTWNSTTVADGSHTIYAKASDAAGNVGTDSVAITVRNTVVPGTYTAIFGNSSDSNYPNTIEDTFIDINANVNATGTLLSTYTWPANTPCNAIITKWNLSALPAGAQIQSATLQLYMNYLEAGGGDTLYTVPVHKIINKSPDVSKANGLYYDGTNPWDPSNIPYNSIPLAQSNISPAVDTQQLNMTNGYKSWNVTSIVKDWVASPASNYGILVNGSNTNSADSNRGFASTRATDPDQRPKLVITYTTGLTPVKNVGATIISK